MDLTKEDREGEECATKISLGGTPSRAALALAAAAAITVLAGEDGKEQESQAAARSAAWKNSYLRQLAKRAKREYASGSIAGSSVDDASLLSDREGSVSGGGRGTEQHRRAGMQLAVQSPSARSDRCFRDTRTIISRDSGVRDTERVCIRATYEDSSV